MLVYLRAAPGGAGMVESWLGISAAQVSDLRTDRTYLSIDPTYWMRFRTTQDVLQGMLARLAFRPCEFRRISGLWYSSPPKFWGPQNPEGAQFWSSDDGKVIRLLCVDSSTDVVYVWCSTY
jgi:hypothetical protein